MIYRAEISFDLGRCFKIETDATMQRSDLFHFLRRGIESYTKHKPEGLKFPFDEPINMEEINRHLRNNELDVCSAVFLIHRGVVLASHRMIPKKGLISQKFDEFAGDFIYSVSSESERYAWNVADSIRRKIQDKFPSARRYWFHRY